MPDDRTSPARTGGPAWPRGLRYATAAYAVAGAAVTLIGWATGIEALTGWKRDGISMFPNTAACILASGLALLLRELSPRRWPAAARVILPGFAATTAGLTLLEHLTGVDLGIDTLLFDAAWGQFAAVAPMRMGPPACVSLVLIGTALVLLDGGPRARRASVACGIAVAAIASLSLTGHLYGAQQMYTLPRLTGIAMQTASMLFGLGLGIVTAVPEREPMRTLLEPSAAGMLARRAWPIVVVLALTLGWLRVTIETHGLVDTAFGTALRTVVELALLTGLLSWAVAMIRTHEQALRASEAEGRRQATQVAAFLDTAAVCLHRVGPDGTILWANDAELQTFGWSREEYVGHHIAEFHVDDVAIAEIMARLHRGERIVEYAARMKCKDGTIKSVLVDSSVLWDEGRFVHTQCFTRDVTDRVQIEATRELLAAIIEASDDAIVSKRLDGVITSWNAGAERMYGYTVAEAVGERIDLIIPPDRRSEEQEILRRLRRGERIEHFDTVRRAKNGRLLEVSLTISPVKDEAGRIIGASKIARDVSDRKRIEREREEGNRRKDEFLAILAHELRNPLGPVRNAARYLKLKASPEPELRRPVDMIERQVAQMSRLIDDLLDVSRISRGVLELRRERVGCAEIVDAAVDACRDEIRAKGHRLHVSVPAAPLTLHADRERLVQILCNLLGNATKYTPAGGHIELTVAARDGGLEISVRDDGVGIPAEKLPDIFDLFVRVENALERQGGLGIGLTLVRQLVELHHGTIDAHSAGVGHGSEFVVHLPVIAATATDVPALADARPAGGPLRIVVADDSRDAVESLALLLRMGGHDVHEVFDGEAAIRSVEHVRPHVALLDIGMPKANGYEVAQHIRERAWGRHVHLIALTGWGQEADRRRAQQAGFDAHLVKPVAPEALERLLAGIGAGLAETPAAESTAPRPARSRTA